MKVFEKKYFMIHFIVLLSALFQSCDNLNTSNGLLTFKNTLGFQDRFLNNFLSNKDSENIRNIFLFFDKGQYKLLFYEHETDSKVELYCEVIFIPSRIPTYDDIYIFAFPKIYYTIYNNKEKSIKGKETLEIDYFAIIKLFNDSFGVWTLDKNEERTRKFFRFEKKDDSSSTNFSEVDIEKLKKYLKDQMSIYTLIKEADEIFFLEKDMKHGNSKIKKITQNFCKHAKICDYVNINLDKSPPKIIITDPPIKRGVVRYKSNTLLVKGTVTDESGVLEVKVNDEKTNILPDNKFKKQVILKENENKIQIEATDTNGNQATRIITILGRSDDNDKRIALIIGNSDYINGRLYNPLNDATDMNSTLKALGFSVMKYENCDQKTMKKAIDKFGKQLDDHEVGLFFYAGHGVQVSGKNYLIPVDAKLENENDVEYDCVRADRILAKMEGAGSRTNIVILDACRDNPFEKRWKRGSEGSGLAFMNAPSGSLIAYATSPGNTALNGSGRNGLYTSALLRHIKKPNLKIEEVFKIVRKTVIDESNGMQIPWESTSLTGEFYFKKQ